MPRSKATIELKRESIRKRERELCREKSKDRRFNNPLKVFVQRKHKKVYEEYCKLYERMVAEYPPRRDLCKTNAFYRFLIDNPEDNPEDNFNNINAELTNGDVQTTSVLFVPRVVFYDSLVVLLFEFSFWFVYVLLEVDLLIEFVYASSRVVWVLKYFPQNHCLVLSEDLHYLQENYHSHFVLKLVTHVQ